MRIFLNRLRIKKREDIRHDGTDFKEPHNLTLLSKLA